MGLAAIRQGSGGEYISTHNCEKIQLRPRLTFSAQAVHTDWGRSGAGNKLYYTYTPIRIWE